MSNTVQKRIGFYYENNGAAVAVTVVPGDLFAPSLDVSENDKKVVTDILKRFAKNENQRDVENSINRDILCHINIQGLNNTIMQFNTNSSVSSSKVFTVTKLRISTYAVDVELSPKIDSQGQISYLTSRLDHIEAFLERL